MFRVEGVTKNGTRLCYEDNVSVTYEDAVAYADSKPFEEYTIRETHVTKRSKKYARREKRTRNLANASGLTVATYSQ